MLDPSIIEKINEEERRKRDDRRPTISIPAPESADNDDEVPEKKSDRGVVIIPIIPPDEPEEPKKDGSSRGVTIINPGYGHVMVL